MQERGKTECFPSNSIKNSSKTPSKIPQNSIKTPSKLLKNPSLLPLATI
jgi:hypothetical protein